MRQTPIPGLDSTGPEETLKTRLDLFGQFVGDWTFDVTNFNLDGPKLQGSGVWYFAWVLEGRAIQYVWTAHYRPSKPGDLERGYGTTLRFYDPKIDAWRVTWISPLSDTIILFTAPRLKMTSSWRRKTRPVECSTGSFQRSLHHPFVGERSAHATAGKHGLQLRNFLSVAWQWQHRPQGVTRKQKYTKAARARRLHVSRGITLLGFEATAERL